MMASDSEASDYEDAGNHHDNNEEDVDVWHVANANPVMNQNNANNADEDNGNNNQHIENDLNDNNDPNDEFPIPLDPDVRIIPFRNVAFAHHNVIHLVDSDEDDGDVASNNSYQSLDTERLSGRNSSDEESHGGDGDTSNFDRELPLRHSYLGNEMEELHGRVDVDEDSTPEIPLIVMGIQLVPGQTLPMTVFHAAFQNAIRRCVVSNRVFGIINTEHDRLSLRSVVNRGDLGTLAEIYEFQEEGDHNNPTNPSLSTSFALKARGRQRFNVLEVRRQADGNLMGRVRIRPEIRLPFFMKSIMCDGSSTFRYKFPTLAVGSTDFNHSIEIIDTKEEPCSSKSLKRGCGDISVDSDDLDLVCLKKKIKQRKVVCQYYSVYTPWPYFVYLQYDEHVLVEKIHHKLKHELKGLAETVGNRIPQDATQLSYWLTQNLTMEDSIKTKMLKMDGPIERLKFALDLLGRVYKAISCRYCENVIGDCSDIFSMSIEGPQGTYVNPSGFVHEILTLYATKELVHRGLPSTEASWFPGYSWTIVECRRCNQHMGWKFKVVTGRLKPAKFWGLTRRSVSFKYDFAAEIDEQVGSDNVVRNSSATSTQSDFNE